MNRLREYTVSKQIIVPKGAFDNIKVMQSLTYEVPEGETPDFDMAWSELNLELSKEIDSVEAKIAEFTPKVEPSNKSYIQPIQENMCPIHNVAWEKEGIGKNGKPYAYHRLSDGTTCWRQN